MKQDTKVFFLKLVIVILLTILNFSLSSCAFFKLEANPEENDPIAQAVYRHTARYSEDEKRELAERISLQEREVQRALASGHLTLGMKKDDVLSTWGHPREIETAGNPESENEKW